VHPLFDDTLKRMIDVERRHIDWVNAWLRSNETEPASRARPTERAASRPNS
jgi:rubrerythrin